MSGPIVRSGASPEFSKNWDNIFGKAKKKSTKASSATAKKSAKKKTPKAAKKAKK
ncbi:MAG: hypothetical protein KDA63_17450 [Planctomycetales bacterium]|nr:hypothetical protein [Planctomycetales bacterium]